MTEVIQLIGITAQVAAFDAKQGREQFCIGIAEGLSALLVLKILRIGMPVLCSICFTVSLFVPEGEGEEGIAGGCVYNTKANSSTY